MTTVLSPSPFLKFFDPNGLPAAGYKLFTYSAGTTTKIVTYVDSTGVGTNTNPIILDPYGQANVWLQPNTGYKYVLAYPTDTDPPANPLKTTDNIIQSQLITLYGGVDTGAANAYILNFSASFTAYSAVPLIYWVPSNSNSGASNVNVNGLGIVGIYNADGSNLGANQIIANKITGMIYQTNIANSGNSGFVLLPTGNFTGAIIGTLGTETPLASAATTDLGSATAHVVLVTGTTTITSFGSSASLQAPIYFVRFNGALTLTYSSTSMILPGSASIVTSAGDALIAQYMGAGAWKVLFYQYGTGSANTKIKPADTVTTTSTTLTADPDLITNTLAIGRYAFEIYLVFDSVTNTDGFKWTNVGTAVDARASMPTLVSGFVNSAAYGPKSESPYSNTISYATVAVTANSNIVLYKGSLLVGTVGTFGVSWAKVANGASAATTLRAGSYLTTTLLNTGAAATGLTHTFSSGSGTEVIPSGYNTLTIEVWGGSGGGGLHFVSGPNQAGGGGGASGAYSRSVITVTGLAGDTAPWSIGNGGGATVAGGPSTVGGGTLPMTTMTANGGGAGANATFTNAPGAGGVGGSASGGTALNLTGNAGQSGQNNANGGAGGFGGGSIPGIYGAPSFGGGVGNGTNGSAGTGGNGLIIFTYSV